MITEIQLSNIQLEAFCGCLPRERTHRVSLRVDVRVQVHLDIGVEPSQDLLENTLDYRRVLDTVQQTAVSRHFALVESLAENMAAAVLALHPQVRSVIVSVAKPNALEGGVIPTITAVQTRTNI
mgnify:CR=1 FL=1